MRERQPHCVATLPFPGRAHRSQSLSFHATLLPPFPHRSSPLPPSPPPGKTHILRALLRRRVPAAWSTEVERALHQAKDRATAAAPRDSTGAAAAGGSAGGGDGCTDDGGSGRDDGDGSSGDASASSGGDVDGWWATTVESVRSALGLNPHRKTVLYISTVGDYEFLDPKGTFSFFFRHRFGPCLTPFLAPCPRTRRATRT